MLESGRPSDGRRRRGTAIVKTLISKTPLYAAALLAGVGGAQAQIDRVVPESATQVQLSYAPVVKRAAPAVVNIFAQKLVRQRRSPMFSDPFFERFFGRMRGPGLSRRRLERSLGSGVIVSPKGLVVTNQHVIGDAVEITVALNDRREFSAEVLLADSQSDLAVLQLDGAEALPFLEFGDSDALEVGDLVLAIGNPFGVGQTVTTGILSATARTASGGRTFLQTDAAINPGNSGGALVDLNGRLIGVNSAILTRSGGSNGVGFAIPATLAAQAVAQARSGAMRLSRPWLGVAVQSVDAEIARSLGFDRPQGVILTAVAAASPFAEAGLTRGAVVMSVDGDEVDDAGELTFRLTALGVGATARLEVLDRGDRRFVDLQLIDAPEDPPRRETEISGRTSLTGLTVANLNPALAEELGAAFGAEVGRALMMESGVVVLGARGPSARYGLRAGDLIVAYNGFELGRVAEFEDLLQDSPRIRGLEIVRGGRRLTLRRR